MFRELLVCLTWILQIVWPIIKSAMEKMNGIFVSGTTLLSSIDALVAVTLED